MLALQVRVTRRGLVFVFRRKRDISPYFGRLPVFLDSCRITHADNSASVFTGLLVNDVCLGAVAEVLQSYLAVCSTVSVD